MFKIILFIVFFFLTPINAFSIYIDSMDKEQTERFEQLSSSLKSYENAYINKFVFDETGIVSGKGESVHEYIFTQLPIWVSNNHKFKRCLEKKENNINWPLCSDNMEEFFPQKGYSVGSKEWKVLFPFYHDRVSKLFWISNNNHKEQVKNTIPVIVWNESNNKYGKEAQIYFTWSQWLAIARNQHLKKGYNPYSTCELVTNKFYYCEKINNGGLALSGLFLLELAVNCKTCSNEDVLWLKYEATSSLMKTKLNSKPNKIGIAVYKVYKEAWIKSNFNIKLLNDVYLESLTH